MKLFASDLFAPHTLCLTPRSSFWGAIFTFSFILLATSAQATVRYVKTDGSDSNTGLSWGQAYLTVQKALETAVSGDEIWVKAGTYKPTKEFDGTTDASRDFTFYLKDGVAVYGGFAGTENLLSQRNWTSNVTILSGDIGTVNDNSDNCHHVVLSVSDASTTKLDGFTVTKGNADGSGSVSVETKNIARTQGGGMYNNTTSATVTNCIFDNLSGTNSGGMYNTATTGVTVTACVFSGNTSTAMTTASGAVTNNVSAVVTFTNCSFSGNSGNTAGAMLNTGSVNAVVTNCMFSGNSSDGSAGAMVNQSSSNAVVTNCLFSGNYGVNGAFYNNSSSPTLTNCTISGNSTLNLSSAGGLTNNSSTPTLKNCLIWNNRVDVITGSAAANLVNNSSIPIISYSLIQNHTPAGTGNLNGITNAANSNYPSFVTLLDPATTPSTAGDFHLTNCSPVLNLGDNTGAPTTDLFGNSRPFATTVDLGVHELQAAATCPAPGTIWFVDAAGTACNSGTSWVCAFQNLQDAINAASSGHEIWVKTGTYFPTKDPFGNASPTDPRDKTFYLKDGVKVYGGFAGTETLRTQRNWTTNPTTLSGDLGTVGSTTDNAYHVVLSVSDAAATELGGFKIEKGNATAPSSITVETKTITRIFGGGMYNTISSPTVSNCVFSENNTDNYGGGMYNAPSSSPSISNCTFLNNTALYDGGGMFNNSNSNPTLTNCIFSANVADGYGGGMDNSSTSNPTLTNCLFTGNDANVGGGMRNHSSVPNLTNCVLSGNRAVLWGGGMASSVSSHVILKNCIIWNNRASTTTGSLDANFYTFSSTPVISYSLIQNHNPSGTGNLNGIPNAATSNYPSFTTPLDPATAPSTSGDFHITNCSPLLNLGTNTGAPTTDLFGNSRPFATTVDLGVHELQAAAAAVPTITCPANQTGTNPYTLADFTSLASTTGTCTPISITQSPAIGTSLAIGMHTITLTATASNGATATCAFTVTVNSNCPATGTVWYVNPAAVSGGNGASWACGFQNVQDAINAASSGHEIWVKTGTYLPTKDPFGNASPTDPRDKTFYLKNGVAVYGGFAGTETLRSQRNWTANPTILSGDIGTANDSTDNCYHVVLSVSDANTTVLDGFTVTKGNGSGGFTSITVETKPIIKYQGGGLNTNSSALTVANCTVASNKASYGGGAYNEGGSATYSNCIFTLNTSKDFSTSLNGGGMYNQTATLTLTSCTFSNNTSGYGGGIFNQGTCALTLTGCNFLNNYTGSGGGIYSYPGTSNTTNLTMSQCKFSGNTAWFYGGGGLYNDGTCTGTATNCLFSGNKASNYAGIYAGSLAYTNCAFSGNWNETANNSPTVQASSGSFKNCVFWNNRSGTVTGSVASSIGSSTAAFTYCLAQAVTPSGTGNLNGITNAATSNYPNFVAPLDPTTAPSTAGDFHIQTGSPLANAGTNTGAPSTDLFGNLRPSGASSDIGVHELLESCPATGTIWYVNSSAASGGNGASWACGFQNLQDAINAASSGHEIWVKAGTYLPTKEPDGTTDTPRDFTFYLKNGVAVYGGFAGTETLRSQRNWTSNPTILSGDIGTSGNTTDDCYHVLLSVSDASTTVLDGFTVTKGNANGAIGSLTVETKTINLTDGGGMNNNSSSPTIANCTFSANLGESGGGIYNIASSPAVSNCTFSNNTTSNIGGAMTNVFTSNPTLTNCTFSSNSATNFGGAMENNTSDPILINCTFAGNSSNKGGAMDNYSGADVTLTNCSFSGNSASDVGGGMYNLSASPNMTNCTFSGNKATTSGGAIQNTTCSPTLKNCLIWNNRVGSTTGSADASMTNSTATPTITYSLIQNWNPSGTGNLNGIPNAATSNYPNFVTPLDPATAPATGGDFHIQTCSPAVNKGTNTGAPTTDLFGNTRPYNSGVADMGVHELQAAQPTPTITCPANQTGTTPYTLADFTSITTTSSGCGTVSLSQSPAIGTSLAVGMHTITMTATDALGTTATCSFTVTVNSNCPATSTIWYVNPSAASGGNGASWACGFQNVQDAINAASSGHEVWVKTGTYFPTKDPSGNASPADPRDKTFYMKNGVAVYGGFAGMETLRSQRNWTTNPTILSADLGTANDLADNAYHVVLSISDANTTVLDGFTIEKGNANGSGSISIEFATVLRTSGGGLRGSSTAMLVSNCQFSGNEGGSGSGGGGGFLGGSSTVTFTNCQFLNNSVATAGGGVLVSACSPTFTDCTFSGNSAGYGGGLYTINTGANPVITRCIFSGNTAAGFGGGMQNYNGAPTLTNCIFSGNKAPEGGGMHNIHASANSQLFNCTFSGNHATISGGAFYNSIGTATLSNCLIWNNREGSTNGSASASLLVNSGTVNISYSLIQNQNPSGTGNLNGIPNAADSNYPNFVTPLDPITAPSTSGDFHIGNCSPAINSGTNTGAPSTDLFGNARPFGTTVDMGVHELQSAPTPVVATCQNITVNLDGAGNGTLSASSLNNGSTGCATLSFSASQTAFTCANLGANTVTLTVTGANGSTGTCTATVTVVDQLAPNALCRDFVKNLSAGGTASITAAEVNNLSSDNCGTVNLVSVSPNSFTCSNIGANTVTLTVNDGHGNTSTCNATVTVADATPPTATCQNISVNLNSGGTASITAAQVNNGSTDNCGVATTIVSPSSFGCANTGPQTVTLTVTDVNSLSSTCTAVVTISDATNPTAICQNFAVNLNSGGTASVTSAQVNNGSSDNCGIASLTVLPSTFACANVGANTVTLTATDNSGRTSTCTATVTVADVTNPSAVCQPVTVNLDGSGNASVSGAQVDGGSTDNCGIASRSVTPNTFTSANIGANTVTLTVTDNNARTATCTAIVTVTNTNLPNAVCQPYTAVLNSGGTVSITAANVDGGSTAVGGIAIRSVSPNSFTCSNLGTNIVVLTVTGNNGLSSTCNATVTVQDNTSPTAVCQNLSVNLSGSTSSITAAQILNAASSSDNCGTVNAISVLPNSFNCNSLGANTVTLTANDGHGNTATCTAVVTVSDATAPTALCQNVSVNLNAIGTVSVGAAQVNNASTDNCGSVNLVSVVPNTFTCVNLGQNTVTLTVNDGHGNTATCLAIVSVADNLAPSALCRDIVAQLDGSGNATITAAQVNNGSSDNCALGALTVSPSAFTLANLGVNTVTLTVSDANSNSATCTAVVTVDNNQLPNAVCQNIARSLGSNGTVVLTAAEVDGGSTALGGIAMRSVSPTTLNCSNLGAATVVLTIVGNNGQQASCNATVTVSDNLAPTAVCQNIAVNLSGSTANITAAQILNVASSSDNCGTVNAASVFPNSFNCTNLGANTVTLTANDGYGNTASCTAVVTVSDATAPTVVCQNIAVNLSGSTANITAAQILNVASSSDNCGTVNASSVSPNSFNCTNLGANTVTLTANDGHGNTATCTAVVTVSDATAPTVVCQNIAVNLSGSTANITAAQLLNAASSSDNCGTVNAASVLPNSFNCTNLGANTVTLTANDGHGNTASCTAVVTVSDATAPTVVCQNIAVNLSGSTANITAAQILNAASSSDNCGTVNASSVLPNSFNCTNLGANTVTLTANDGHGNTATCTAVVTVSDATAPTVVCQNIAVNLSGSTANITAAQLLNAASSSDNCGTVNASSVLPNSFNCTNLGTNTVTLTANDGYGNTATCTAVVTVSDATAPTVVCQNIAVNLSGSTANITAAQILNVASSSDNCGIVNAQGVTPNAFTCSNLGANTVTLTANDGHGNTATCTAVVTVSDATAPTVVCQNISVNLSGSTANITAAQILNVASSSDNCGTVNASSVLPNSFNCTNLGTNTVTLTANDGRGNTATCTAIVTVQAAEINLRGNGTDILDGDASPSTADHTDFGQTTGSPIVRTFTVQNTGAVALPVSGITIGGANPGQFSVGPLTPASPVAANGSATFTVTYAPNAAAVHNATVNIANGDCDEAIYDFAVRGELTCTAPTFTACPSTPLTAPAANGLCSAALAYSVIATGIPSPALTYAFTGATTGTGSGTGTGASFNTGITTVTVMATNPCGMPTCTFTVTVSDTQNPSITCPGNMSKNTDANQCTAVTNYTNPSFSDNCAGVFITRTSGPASGSAFPIGTTMVEWKATDVGGNSSTCSFVVNVLDAQAPNITCPANIVRGTDLGQCNAIVTYATPTATDNCTTAIVAIVTSSLNSGSVFSKGVSTVVWKATDTAGNTQTCAFTVTVNDTQKPTITCPANKTQSTDANLCSAIVSYTTPTVTDNCTPNATVVPVSGGTGTIQGMPNSSATFDKGMNTVIWKATDATGNTQTCSFRVTVNDTEAPTMTCPAAISLSTATNTCSATATYTNPSFTDNCAPTTGVATRISGLISGSTFPIGNSNVVFQATDAAGNTRRCTMVVTVTDNQPPVITCPAPVVVTGSGTPCKAVVFYGSTTASDNCAGTLTPFLFSGLSSGSQFPAGVTTNTFRAVAPNGQSSECSFTVTVDCGSVMSHIGVEVRKEDLSVQHSDKLDLKVAPNPALSTVTVSIEGVGTGGGTLLVFDAVGRLVLRQVIAENQRTAVFQVEGSEFAPGLYRVNLRTERGMVTKTLVVVKE